MIPKIRNRDITGRLSRTMTTGQLMLILGMIQAALSVSGIPIPAEYQWVNGVALAALGQYIQYLRMTTTTAMQ